MSRTKASNWLGYTVLAVAVVVLAAGISSAQDVYQTTYYTNPQGITSPDSTIHLVNPGTAVTALNRNGFPTNGNLCAFVYVFNNNEEEVECCGCVLSPDSQTTLSLHNDLLKNPLNVHDLTNDGVIKVISGPPNNGGSCDPTGDAAPIVPAPELRAWATHIQAQKGSNVETEEPFADVPLSADELTFAENLCSDISGGSGHGVCSCGYGDD
jgi:hypothetical protein